MHTSILKFFINRLWVMLLILSYLLLSYYTFNGWWNSSIGTLLIFLFSYLIWHKSFLNVIGFDFTIIIAVKSILLVVIVIFCSWMTMGFIAGKFGISIQPTNWRNYYHDVFYILNEEIMLGAIILFVMINQKKIHPIIASVGLAIAFSLIHYIFYRWIFADKGIIKLTTLLTLFLIGFVRNNLIIQTGHIGYSWALHFGWMLVMFGYNHQYLNSEVWINEPERFNLYLGSTEMIIISVVLAIISFIYLIKKSTLTKQNLVIHSSN